jgi:hypothetical protein
VRHGCGSELLGAEGTRDGLHGAHDGGTTQVELLGVGVLGAGLEKSATMPILRAQLAIRQKHERQT